MEHIVIIGNGISGITAARHIRKLSDKRITVISDEADYFFARTALMYVYMGHMTFEHIQPYENWFWKKNRIELKKTRVSDVAPKENQLTFTDGEKLHYDKLIIASGSQSNKFGWPGEDLKGVQGLYSKQDLNLLEANAPNNEICKRAVIVGGGLIGIELTKMLSTRNIPVTFLIREHNFWGNAIPKADAQLINKHIYEHGIDLRLDANLKEITSDENGRAKAVVVEETGEKIPCNVVGLATGVSPNVEFLKDSGIELGKGIRVNPYLETNIENIFAIGDCAEQKQPIGNRKPIEAVWYTGRMMGETVAQTICRNRMPYRPSHWFNSAKFFDIEFQTYGWVFSEPRAGESHFHWHHADKKKGITINYETPSRKFIGINTFGIRMRHEVFDRWLTEEKTVDEVIENLEQANFDPEFYKPHESDIKEKFLQEKSTSS